MLTKQKILLYRSLGLLKDCDLEIILNYLKPEAVNNICECVFNVIRTDLKLPDCRARKIRKSFKNKTSKKNIDIILNRSKDSLSKLKALKQEKKGLKAILDAVNILIAKKYHNV